MDSSSHLPARSTFFFLLNKGHGYAFVGDNLKKSIAIVAVRSIFNKSFVALNPLQYELCCTFYLTFLIRSLQQKPCCARPSATRILLQFFQKFFLISAIIALLRSTFCNKSLVAKLFSALPMAEIAAACRERRWAWNTSLLQGCGGCPCNNGCLHW